MEPLGFNDHSHVLGSMCMELVKFYEFHMLKV